jgi:hypothetical protein
MAVQNYLDLITSEHRNSSNFIVWLTDNLNIVDEIYLVTQGLDQDFDLDVAIGDQLDILGILVGVSRNLNFQPIGYDPVLDDDSFRFLIKAKIAKNHWDGTIPDLYDVWSISFPDTPIAIFDYQDMSFLISFINPIDIVDLKLQLVTNDYIIPKPEGVHINYLITYDPPFTIGQNSSSVIDNTHGFSSLAHPTYGGELAKYY